MSGLVVDLMRPDPDHVRSCVCFELRTLDELAVDVEGQKWDLCKGECARAAGVEESQPVQEELPL